MTAMESSTVAYRALKSGPLSSVGTRRWVGTPIGEGNGIPLQYSCFENPMDGGAWKAAVHGFAKSQTRLSDFTFTFHFHALEKEMATHSSVLAWRIPGMAEPGRLPSMGSHKVGHDWSHWAAGNPYNGWCLEYVLRKQLQTRWGEGTSQWGNGPSHLRAVSEVT